MGYFEIGLSLGLFIYGLLVFLLTFVNRFKEFFYGDLMEDTILGEAGEYLFFPNQYQVEESDAGKTFVNIMALIFIHLGLFVLTLIVFTIVGGLLAPFILLGLFIGPIIYMFVKRKRAKKLALLQEDEETS